MTDSGASGTSGRDPAATREAIINAAVLEADKAVEGPLREDPPEELLVVESLEDASEIALAKIYRYCRERGVEPTPSEIASVVERLAEKYQREAEADAEKAEALAHASEFARTWAPDGSVGDALEAYRRATGHDAMDTDLKLARAAEIIATEQT